MKKWLNGIAVVLLCVAAAAGCFYFIGEARLTKKIAGLKAQGVPTSFAELEAYSKLPEGTANAADIYMKAFAAYRPLADEKKQKMLPVMGNQLDPNDNEPYPAERMAAAAEFIEQNKEMFALLHEAGQVEGCYYPITYSVNPLFMDNTLTSIKKPSHSLAIAGVYYSQTNQPQKAYDAAMDQLRLGQSVCRPYSQFGHLLRLATLGMGTVEIRNIINRTSLDEAQLQQLQGYLQQISQSISFEPVLLGEMCVCLESRKLSRPDKNAPAVKADTGQCTMDLFSWDAITLIDACQQMIAIDKLPIQEQLPKAKEAGDVILFSALSRSVLFSVAHAYKIHLRIRANMNCAITALAVERYRLKEGKLPETPDALVPRYLPGVYMDPFDGQPLRYKRDDAGYMIYTIGEDGVDNGGRGWDRKTKTQDWVFRVYR